MNISITGSKYITSQNNSKTKQDYINVCNQVYEEVKQSNKLEERVEKLNTYLEGCDELAKYLNEKNATLNRRDGSNIELLTSDKLKRVSDNDKAKRMDLYNRATNAVAKIVSLSTLIDSNIFKDLTQNKASRKEKSYLIPHGKSAEDIEEGINEFLNASPKKRSQMFADKIKNIKNITIKLFNAKTNEDILEIAEEDPMAFNSLGEYDKLDTFLENLENNYDISPSKELLEDIAFIKDTAVDAAKYQNIIGIMADPLYTEIDDMEEFYKYSDFMDQTLEVQYNYRDFSKLAELEKAEELTTFVANDLEFVYNENAKAATVKSMMKVYNEQNEIKNPIYFDTEGKKLTIENVAKKVINGEEFRIMGDKKVKSFKANHGIISLGNLEQKKPQTINIDTPKNESVNYLKDLKTLLNSQTTAYTRFKNFFAGSHYSDLIDSIDVAINEYSVDDYENNERLLNDIKIYANEYLNYKTSRNDTSSLSYRRTNAVLEVLDKISTSIDNYEPNEILMENDISFERSSLDLMDAIDNDDEINNDMDEYENDEPQIKKNDVGLDK